MKAKQTAFFCKECGYESAKWMGQCPGCRQWNTFVEEPTAGSFATTKSGGAKKQGLEASKPLRLEEISTDEEDRSSTGLHELDRVLGGGLVTGSLILVGGDPGIGLPDQFFCKLFLLFHHRLVILKFIKLPE